MSIKRVDINQSEHGLEGMLHEQGGEAGVIICHPHPLYGGSMYNNVVEAVEEGFFAKGYNTLRFNFRGVGRSGGAFDEGDGETMDLLSALDFLKGGLNRGARIILAGYSFGAWICSRAAAVAEGVDGMFLVSFPFAFYETDALRKFEKTTYFVGGDRDDISPVEALLKFYKDFPVVDKHLKIISTDHFYGRKEGEIVHFIKDRVEIVPVGT